MFSKALGALATVLVWVVDGLRRTAQHDPLWRDHHGLTAPELCPVDGCILTGPLPHDHDWTASPEARAADYLR